jgi:hypothetical protein
VDSRLNNLTAAGDDGAGSDGNRELGRLKDCVEKIDQHSSVADKIESASGTKFKVATRVGRSLEPSGFYSP